MPVTINANGLSIIHKGSGGEASATLPDVCLTVIGPSVVPVPYPNSAKSSDLSGGSTTVTADGGHSIAIKGCCFSKSSGDAAGNRKGIVSGTIEGKAEFITSSPTVKIEGKGVCRLSDQMTMNNGNTMCLGGTQNPTVTVTEDQEGTYSVDLEVTYDDGEGFQAPYKLTDAKGHVFEGVLNEKGKAEVSGVASGLFNLEYGEDQRVFSPSSNAINNNPHYKDVFDPNVLIEETKIGRIGFWEATKNSSASTGNWIWGVLIGDLNQDPTTGQLMLSTALSVIPGIDQIMDARDITANIFMLSDKENQSNHEHWFNLALSAIGVIPTIGSVMKGVGKAIKHEKSRDDLFAVARGLGKGNVEKFLTEIDWKDLGVQSLQIVGDVIVNFNQVLETLAGHANRFGYEVYAADIINFKAQISEVEKNANQHLPDAVMYFKGLLDQSLNKGKSSSTKSTGTASSTAESKNNNDTVKQEDGNKKERKCWLCEKPTSKNKKTGHCHNPSEEKDYYAITDKKHGYTERGDFYSKYRNKEPETKAQEHYAWRLLKVNKNIIPETHPLFARCYDEIYPSINNEDDDKYYTRPNQVGGKTKALKVLKYKKVDTNKYNTCSKPPLQAHHVIPTAQMKNNEFLHGILPYLGYDFNQGHNITILPCIPELACFYQMPLHTSNHGTTKNPSPYTINIAKKLSRLELNIKNSKYCKGNKKHDNMSATIVCDKMKEISRDTLDLISNFNKKGALNLYHYNVYHKDSRGCCNQLSHGKDMQTSNLICRHRKEKTNHSFRIKHKDDNLSSELKIPELEGK